MIWSFYQESLVYTGKGQKHSSLVPIVLHVSICLVTRIQQTTFCINVLNKVGLKPPWQRLCRLRSYHLGLQRQTFRLFLLQLLSLKPIRALLSLISSNDRSVCNFSFLMHCGRWLVKSDTVVFREGGLGHVVDVLVRLAFETLAAGALGGAGCVQLLGDDPYVLGQSK